MPEPPAPDTFTLTPYERGLCVVLALLWGGFAVFALFTLRDFIFLIAVFFDWAHQQGERLLAGKLPALSINNLCAFLITSTFLGAAILGPLYFGYLAKFDRWLRPGALWFWTMIHWMLPMVFGLIYWGSRLVESDLEYRFQSANDDFVITLITFVVPLPLIFASLYAWKQRRQKKPAGKS